MYDLFPLKTGNEFYYRYIKKRYTGIYAYTNGTEKWKVVSEAVKNDSIKYIIERSLNYTTKVGGLSITISDSINYLEIDQDIKTSMISFWKFSFKRYQDVSQTETKREYAASNGLYTWSCILKADSGMTRYSYYHPPNNVTNENLYLDSLKIVD